MPPCSLQAALRDCGVPGQVLSLHAHWRGCASGGDGGQAAGSCVLRNQDTNRTGNELGLSLGALPSTGGSEGLLYHVGDVGTEIPSVKQGGSNLDHAFPCA